MTYMKIALCAFSSTAIGTAAALAIVWVLVGTLSAGATILLSIAGAAAGSYTGWQFAMQSAGVTADGAHKPSGLPHHAA